MAGVKPPTRGERNVAWIEHHCRVPEGSQAGAPIVLRPWQREIILGIYDSPTQLRYAIISYGKKNGKTALAAMLLLLHLCGPESKVNSQLYSAAQSKEQAALSYSLAVKMVRMSPDLDAVLAVRETIKEVHCPELGTSYKALSAEVSTKHGMSPIFAIHDELGQVKGPRSPLFDAIETADMAHKEPLSVIISTQAESDGDLLSVLIDDALTNKPKDTRVWLWTAARGLDPFSDEALLAANPACGDFLSHESLRSKAERARRMPSAEATYRNYTLNQRISHVAPFVSESAWRACSDQPDPDVLHGATVYAAIDLSSKLDLTAMPYGARDEAGVWHVFVDFFAPQVGVYDRAQRDHAPYDLWAEQGYLTLTPGASVDYGFVAARLAEIHAEYDLAAVAFDRWHIEQLRKELDLIGAVVPLVPHGQGFRDMSPSIDSLEAALVEGRMRHGGHPVLTMCAANTRTTRDAAGNRKLDKGKATGRIDGMVALAMLMGAVRLATDDDSAGKSVYESRGLVEVTT